MADVLNNFSIKYIMSMYWKKMQFLKNFDTAIRNSCEIESFPH